jgi:GGDEF domain-containing protein
VLAPASDRTAEQLLREADAAMYRHKERRRSSEQGPLRSDA